MIHPPDKPELFFFGQWSFNSDAGDLSKGETTTRLEPQVAKLPKHFLANQQKVISRDELNAAVWESRNVSSAFRENILAAGYLSHVHGAVTHADRKTLQQQGAATDAAWLKHRLLFTHYFGNSRVSA